MTDPKTVDIATKEITTIQELYKPWSILWLVFLLAHWAIADETPGAASTKAAHVRSQTHHPFGLTDAEISNVEISLLTNSQKAGAADQEIHVSGKGLARVRIQPFVNSKQNVLEGPMEKKVFIALLSLMEEQNFLGLDDLYPYKIRPHGVKIITLKGPRLSKSVKVQEGHPPEFERIVGAIKLAVGLGILEAVNQKVLQLF